MKTTIGLLAGVAALAVVAMPAKADLVRFGGGTNEDSFVELGGLGFGNAPRLLTLHTSPLQVGASTPAGPVGDAVPGANKSEVKTLGQLGWAPGEFVAVGYNMAETGNSGITLNSLTLSLYNASGVLVDSFSTSGPIQYSEDDGDLQQGNGTGIFAFILNAAQRAEWNALTPQANWIVGLAASMGCAGTASATCQPSDGGPDSFLAIAAGTPGINPLTPNPVPIPGAFLLMGTVLVGGGGFAAWRRRRERKA